MSQNWKQCWLRRDADTLAHSHHTFSKRVLKWGAPPTSVNLFANEPGTSISWSPVFPPLAEKQTHPNVPKGKVEQSDADNHEHTGDTAPLPCLKQGGHTEKKINIRPRCQSLKQDLKSERKRGRQNPRHVWLREAAPLGGQTHGWQVERRPTGPSFRKDCPPDTRKKVWRRPRGEERGQNTNCRQTAKLRRSHEIPNILLNSQLSL